MDRMIDNINYKLDKMGINYDSLKPFIKDYILQIEKIIENKVSEKEESIKHMNNIKITISSISEELDCSRTTLYNHNQFLKKYIDLSVEEFNNLSPYYVIEKLKIKKSELENKLDKMIERDIDISLLKHENKMLKECINDKNLDIEKKQKRIQELSVELHDIKLKNNKKSCVVNLK